MVLIGENIHVISKEISRAMRERNAKPLQELAVRQAEAGMDYIDLNIGPAKRDPEVMEWLVRIVEEVVDLPLSLDTMNPVAMEIGIKACRKNKPLINSASNRTESKQQMLPLAVKYDCDVVLSVITDRGCPPGVDDRVSSILEAAAYANELGIPNERLWVDPIVLPVSANQDEVRAALEFMKILQDLLPGVKSTVGLSNVSNGTPAHLRGILNRTYLVMLERYGLYSAIVDAFDQDLVRLARGELQHIKELIYKVMDEEEVDEASLSKEERDYVRTAKVLLGKTLYSHSWLEE